MLSEKAKFKDNQIKRQNTKTKEADIYIKKYFFIYRKFGKQLFGNH